MSTREPSLTPDSEEELLEQWAFLDSLVERQAAQLRAGIQDTEDVDDPIAQVDALRRDLDRLRAQLRRAEAARDAAEGEARRSRDALITMSASSSRHAAEAHGARQRLTALEQELARWRGRAETAERTLAELELRARADHAELTGRLAEAQAARERLEQEAAGVAGALDRARVEVESLRTQLATAQHGFWRFGRR